MTDRSSQSPDAGLAEQLARIAEALDRLAPDPSPHLKLENGAAFTWRSTSRHAVAAPRAALPLDLILGVDRQKSILVENTRRFAAGLPANDALLWGSRGTGKSALIRAAHAAVAAQHPDLKLLSLPRDALADTPALVQAVAEQPFPVILLLDDLSFEADEGLAKMLKPALDGGAGGRPTRTTRTICAPRKLPKSVLRSPIVSVCGWASTQSTRPSSWPSCTLMPRA